MDSVGNALKAAKQMKSHINYTKPSKHLAEDPRLDAIRIKIKTAAFDGMDGLDWLKSLRKYDKDNTGTICLEDFVKSIRQGQGTGGDEISFTDMRAAFFRVDKKSTGRLRYDTELADWMAIDLDEEMEAWIESRKTEKELTSARAANKAAYTAGLVSQIKRKLKANAYTHGKLDLERLHRYYDRDRTGSLEFDEFKRAVRRDGKITESMATDAVIRKIFRQMDKDDSGSIPFVEEFLPWLIAGDDSKPLHVESPEHTSYFHIKIREKQAEDELDMFEHARRMARAHCYRVGNLKFERFFEKWDKDGHQGIDFEEFRQVLRRDAKLNKLDLPDDKLEKLFKNIDKGGSGAIELSEFTAWLDDNSRGNPQKLKGDHGRGEQLMIEKHKKDVGTRKAELHKKGELIKSKFVAAGYAAGDISLAFMIYDRENSGDATFDEFRKVIRKEARVPINQCTDQSLLNIFRQVDRDGCGTIQVDEFCKWLDYQERCRSKTPPKKKPTGTPNRSRPTTPTSERPFDEQIDRLMGLVRVQTEEIARMRRDHEGNLAQLRTEYDALIACLDSSGLITEERIHAELQQQLKNQKSMAQRKPISVQAGRSRTPPPRIGPNSIRPLGPSSDLFELSQPLLQPNPARSVRESALTQIEMALDAGVSPHEWRGIGTPLHAAEKQCDVALAHLLLDKFADVNIVDDGGISVLQQACYDGRTQMVELLLDRLADPNKVDRHGQPPIFFAPSRQVCEALYIARADINAINHHGQSSLHLAARAGLPDVLSWLSKRVSRSLIDMRDLDGFTAVEYAEQAGISSVVFAQNH